MPVNDRRQGHALVVEQVDLLAGRAGRPEPAAGEAAAGEGVGQGLGIVSQCSIRLLGLSGEAGWVAAVVSQRRRRC
jgi:hypothetical protein